MVASVRQSDENDFEQGNDNRQGSKSKYADSIKEQLKRFPRQASHYSPYDESAGKDRILPEDLSYSKCWKQWCRENDKEFAEQADRLKFWRSMDRKQNWPRPSKLKDEIIMKPRCAHSTYHYEFNKYDLRFGKPRVDTCDVCDKFGEKEKAYTIDEKTEKKSEVLLFNIRKDQKSHVVSAKRAYLFQSYDFAKTEVTFTLDFSWPKDSSEIEFMSINGYETQTQDAGGNLRTPRLTVGEAYYLRILQTYTYGIYSHARRQHSIYMWNETIGEKGVNNVLSAEHDHHMNQGTGAKYLKLWFDGCPGQMQNWTAIMYHLYITDPYFGGRMYERLDECLPIKGHSYMENDRAFGHIIQESKGFKTISDYFEWMNIAKNASNANPYRVIEFKQEMHFDWKAFLSQFYVKSRDTIDAFHAKLRGAVWRSYGCSEEMVKQPDGSVKSELVYHPGEVWLRYSHNDKEAWTKVDLRRDCKKKDQYIYSRNAQGFMCNVSTGDLPEPTKKVSEKHKDFPLYKDGLRPIAALKYRDLGKSKLHLAEEKQQYYTDLPYNGTIVDSADEDEPDLDEDNDK